jgi:hypothetical protein
MLFRGVRHASCSAWTRMLRLVLSGLVATWVLSAIRLTAARPLAARVRRTTRRAI